jgi:hypothetical protein
MGSGGSRGSPERVARAVGIGVSSTDSPYLRRVSELDDLAVGIGKTLIQSLTLIHGAGLLAIPTFAKQFEVTLQPAMRLWMLGWFAAGLILVVLAGIVAFYALAARSHPLVNLLVRTHDVFCFTSLHRLGQLCRGPTSTVLEKLKRFLAARRDGRRLAEGQ